MKDHFNLLVGLFSVNLTISDSIYDLKTHLVHNMLKDETQNGIGEDFYVNHPNKEL